MNQFIFMTAVWLLRLLGVNELRVAYKGSSIGKCVAWGNHPGPSRLNGTEIY